VAKLADRLFALDDRVLHITRRQEALRTPEGWRRYAERWRFLLGYAGVLMVVITVESVLSLGSALALLPLFGVLCFRTGQLKAESDRLNRRGYLENNRPPGL